MNRKEQKKKERFHGNQNTDAIQRNKKIGIKPIPFFF